MGFKVYDTEKNECVTYEGDGFVLTPTGTLAQVIDGKLQPVDSKRFVVEIATDTADNKGADDV